MPAVVCTAIGGSSIAAMVVRGEPRLLVVGENQWQVALLLASRTRVLMLTGDLSREAVEVIPMLMSVMRQRIDVVVGPASGLALLPDRFRQRWMVRSFIPLPDDNGTSLEKPAPGRLLQLPGGFHVAVFSVPKGFWAESSRAAMRSATHVITISWSRYVIAIADSLEAIAEFGSGSTTMAVAPGGAIEHIARVLRVPTLCINADQVRDQDIDAGSDSSHRLADRMLVRIFPEDVAEFRLRHDGVAIPSWRQALPDG